MGPISPRRPEHTIGQLNGKIAEQVLYTYFLRPKYAVRQLIHERVRAFKLADSCAVMHVRRGDSIMHDTQSRS
jgi:hypothetical protein